MPNMRLLLFSNLKGYRHGYSEKDERYIKDFLGTEVRRLLFIPYAGVRISFDDYAFIVGIRFKQVGYQIDSLDEAADPQKAVRNAQAFIVGGGNTFHLLDNLYKRAVLEEMRARIDAGAPYIGWSAGATIACPTIQTTNDMLIVEPPSFKAMGLIPFQINPHYTDVHPEGHQGETREERILEFIEMNPKTYVVGLREESVLKVEGESISLLGSEALRVFIKGSEAKEYGPDDSLQFLLESR